MKRTGLMYRYAARGELVKPMPRNVNQVYQGILLIVLMKQMNRKNVKNVTDIHSENQFFKHFLDGSRCHRAGTP